MKYRPLLLLLVSLLLATSAFAAVDRQNVIIVIDRDTGQALLPEGTPFPEDLVIRGPGGKVLPFASAPEERFAAARKTIEETALLVTANSLRPFVYRAKDQAAPPLALPKFNSRFGIRTNLTESQTWYYMYFYDGSYLSALKWIHDVSPYGWQFAVRTEGYTPENDWYSGWIYCEQSSADHPGYDVTAYCTVNSSGGYCNTPTYAYQDGENFTATVTAGGNIHHHRLPICGHYGEPPCNENLSDSVTIYFP